MRLALAFLNNNFCAPVIFSLGETNKELTHGHMSYGLGVLEGCFYFWFKFIYVFIFTVYFGRGIFPTILFGKLVGPQLSSMWKHRPYISDRLLWLV